MLIIKINRYLLIFYQMPNLTQSSPTFPQFTQQHSHHSSSSSSRHSQSPPCVKNYLSRPNPLMSKIEFIPQQAKQYYPSTFTPLPGCLLRGEAARQKNWMASLDSAQWSHQKMKRDRIKFTTNTNQQSKYDHLVSLKQYYQHKTPIYQKHPTQSDYFATYLLPVSSLIKQNTMQFNRSLSKTALSSSRLPSTRNSIAFSSNFQSGNLYQVYHTSAFSFDLVLQNDINTKGNTQWFFFSVAGAPKGSTLTFNIVNMSKRDSLFADGMKPAVFSMGRYEKRKVGWAHEGNRITYMESQKLRKQGRNQPYYQLSFQYKFIYEGDIVYFSYAIPYTFSMLNTFLSTSFLTPSQNYCVRFKPLPSTVGQHHLSLIEFTAATSSVALSQRKIIWIMGRQHPGETTSGFMMEGIIKWLISGENQAKFILENYVVKIVPMINADGVVHGNTRAELIGYDPNRKWLHPSKEWQPITYELKKMIERDRGKVELFLDLHSHSRKIGTFFYGNDVGKKERNLAKVFPLMVCKQDNRFDPSSNRYIGGSNLAARKIVFDLLAIPLIYTVQASFYGYRCPPSLKIIPYLPQDYREMGVSILVTFSEYSMKKNKYDANERMMLVDQNGEGEELLKQMEKEEVQSEGSDGQPEQDEFNEKERKKIMPKVVLTHKKKKKCIKKKKIEQPLITEEPPKIVKRQTPSRPRKIERQSHYRKFFSGKSSLLTFPISVPRLLSPPETKTIAIQVSLPLNAVLKRTSMNNLCLTDRINQKIGIGQKRSLCIVGQKVEQDVMFGGINCVGVQVDRDKDWLMNRAEMSKDNAPRRSFKSTNYKIGLMIQMNENNFLNRGDCGHTTKILPKR